jgi:choline dehydrogenase
MAEALREARGISCEQPLAELVIGPELAPTVADDDDAGLQAVLGALVATFHPPVGTCGMGPDPALGAVVDGRGRVHDINAL